MLTAAAGAAQLAVISSQQYQGRRFGGAVKQGTPYEVAEGGRPELFVSRGRSVLLPAADGKVIPLSKAGGVSAGSLKIIINNLPGQNAEVEERESGQEKEVLIDIVEQVVVGQLEDGSSPISRGLTRNYPGTQRGHTS